MFTGAASGSSTRQPEEKPDEQPFGERPDAEETFANVFEEVDIYIPLALLTRH